jgi:hypothetical protein
MSAGHIASAPVSRSPMEVCPEPTADLRERHAQRRGDEAPRLHVHAALLLLWPDSSAVATIQGVVPRDSPAGALERLVGTAGR